LGFLVPTAGRKVVWRFLFFFKHHLQETDSTRNIIITDKCGVITPDACLDICGRSSEVMMLTPVRRIEDMIFSVRIPIKYKTISQVIHFQHITDI